MRDHTVKAVPFGMIALGELWLAWRFPAVGLGLGWCAAATAWVTLSYAWGRPNWLGKARRWRWLLGPYALTAMGVARAAQRLGVSERSEVVPGLWVGGWPRTQSDTFCQLDCTSELGRRGRAEAYRCVPMLDGVAVPERELRAAVSQVQTWRAEGRQVLIHCAFGHGRSVAVACAVMVLEGQAATLEAALALVKTHRPGARLDRAQTAAVLRVTNTLGK